jgi:membrane protease YdiL (CAAX protease family)
MIHSPIIFITFMQSLVIFYLLIFLFFFTLLQKRETIRAIWKDSSSSLIYDCFLGVLTWTISFPVVACITHFAELFTYLIFGTAGPEQLAVRYVRAVAASPSLLTIALISIILFAPFIEEVVFRGFLQSFLKQKIGMKWSIFLTAICFSLFHLSPSQGVGNIPLVISLFALSLYLGFLYERQRSLLAPIALHMTFNSVSVIRILIFLN